MVPDDVPARRAVLAGTVETAVNALWDLAPLVGDRVAVVGAGMVGCAVARLLAQIPGVEVTLVDVDPSRAPVAAALGAGFAAPGRRAARAATRSCTPAAPAPGLRLALELLAPEGEVLELSWYGDQRGRSCRSAARSTPGGSPSGPARSAGSRRRGAGGAPTPTGWRSRSSCSPTRRSTRC